MSEVTRKNFGLLIAYVLPGFVILIGVSLVSPTVAGWLQSPVKAEGPGVGGFFYALIFAVAGGVTASAVRWLVLDRIHQLTGVRRPKLDLQNLEDSFRSFDRVVEDHYRYYEFYGGMLFATLFSYGVWRTREPGMLPHGSDAFFLIIELVFVAASRDALRNYYGRAARVLGTLESEASSDKRIRPPRTGSDSDKAEAAERDGATGTE